MFGNKKRLIAAVGKSLSWVPCASLVSKLDLVALLVHNAWESISESVRDSLNIFSL